MSAATPSQTSAISAKTRVLVVYGSESGNAKRGITRYIKKWEAMPDRNFEIVGMHTGNEIAKKCKTGDGTAMANNLEFVSQLCDVLLPVYLMPPTSGRVGVVQGALVAGMRVWEMTLP